MGTIVYDGTKKGNLRNNTRTTARELIKHRENMHNKSVRLNGALSASVLALSSKVKNMPLSTEHYNFIKDFLIDPKDYGYYIDKMSRGFTGKIEDLVYSLFSAFNATKVIEVVGTWKALGIVVVAVGAIAICFIESNVNGKINKKKQRLEELNIEIGLINAEKELARLKDPLTAEMEEYERQNKIDLYRYLKAHPELTKRDIMNVALEYKEADTKLKEYKLNEILNSDTNSSF